MNPPGKPPHICFYSNHCRWSEAFIKSIKDTPFKHEFTYICVDQNPNLPKWLKKVPTLVIRGEADPRTDGDVMNWLAEKKLTTQRAANGTQDPTEPEPWISGEMGGSYTKGFSFLGGNDTNDAPIGNFEFLNGQSAPGTRTGSDMPPSGGQGAQPKNKKVDLFDKQMAAYMAGRNEGMPQQPRRM
jgi:hypothetical protein